MDAPENYRLRADEGKLKKAHVCRADASSDFIPRCVDGEDARQLQLR